MKFPKQLSSSKYQNWLVVWIDSICLSVRVIPWLFPLVYITSETIGLCNGLSPGRRQAIIWATILCTHLTHTKSGVDTAPMALSSMYCKLIIIDSDNVLSPGRRQAIIWTNAGILLIEPLGTNFSEILIGIQTFSFYENAHENVVCEMASILSQPQCVNTLFSVVKCKRGEPAMHRNCISRLICIEPPVCYLSLIEHASGEIWP